MPPCVTPGLVALVIPHSILPQVPRANPFPMLSFKTRFYTSQASLILGVKRRVTLNSCFSCQRLPGAGITGVFVGTGVEPRPNSQTLCPLEPQPQPVLLAAQRGWLLQASLVCVQRHLLRKAVFFTRSSVCSLAQLILLPAKRKPEWRLHDATATWHDFCAACSSVL